MPLVVAKQRETDLLELIAHLEGAGAVVAGARNLVAERIEGLVDRWSGFESSAAQRTPAPSKMIVTSSPCSLNSSAVESALTSRSSSPCVSVSASTTIAALSNAFLRSVFLCVR